MAYIVCRVVELKTPGFESRPRHSNHHVISSSKVVTPTHLGQLGLKRYTGPESLDPHYKAMSRQARKVVILCLVEGSNTTGGTIRLTKPKLVAVAERSKALASFFRVRLRDSPRFKPSHDAHRQVTLVVEGGFGHGPQHPYLQCLGRLSTLHEQRCSKRIAALLWGRRR